MNYKMIFLLPFIIAVSCKTSDQNNISQGISGQVLWIEGNQMPGPGREQDKGTPVKREIYVYHALTPDKAEGTMPLFDTIKAEPEKIITTTDDGQFTVALPPGKYSLLVKEENKKYFANKLDSENHINAVTVHPNEVSEVTIEINYKAFY